MSLLNDKAEAAAGRLVGDKVLEQALITPAVIAAIVVAITQILQAVVACGKTPQQAAELAADPGIFDRLRAWRAARKALRSEHVLDVNAVRVVNAILETGETVTQAEMVTLYKEASGGGNAV